MARTAFTCLFSLFWATLAMGAKEIPTDAKFLDQFSEHHNHAIHMSEMAQKKAQDPELKKMAKKMVQEQKKEIAQMQKWRKDLFAAAPKAEPLPPMDMSALEKAKGHEFDMAFIDLMSKHHEEGIQMARENIDEFKNPQIKKFAEQSSKSQEKEMGKLAAMKQAHQSH